MIISDGTWVYVYNVETKMQSSQWVGKKFTKTEKVKAG
jgi:hypothetical protein